jgi:asparagine synthase (glutamine-hydrolysing)
MCGIFLYIQRLERYKNIKEIHDKFNKLSHRGPDASVFKTFYKKKDKNDEQINLGFHRLKVIGTKGEFGMQPFYCSFTNTYLLMNGEIYNYLDIFNELKEKHLISSSYILKSDCEIILILYKFFTIEQIVKKIRGEYAFIVLDLSKNKIIMARDELGIRPLFYNVSESDISISSEYKGLMLTNNDIIYNTNNDAVCNTNYQIEPATIYTISLNDYTKVKKHLYYNINTIISYNKTLYKSFIKQKLIEAVQIRLNSERPIGFLLSGGFDSSLVLAIATDLIINNNITKLLPINTFSIQYIGDNDQSDESYNDEWDNIDKDDIIDNDDIYHAKKVVNFLNEKYYTYLNKNIINHKIVYFNKTQGINAIPEVIYYLESKCITTIRASTPMFLLVKYIKENTDIKVLFSGECADELFFSYLYSKYAPNAIEFDNECRTLLKKIYLYDVLRADRVISSQGLEVRVPFSDRDFITEYLSTELKYRYEPDKIEKILIRDAFKDNYLPEETRMRTKEAFSNSVNSNKADWIDDIISYCKYLHLTEEKYYINIMKKLNYPINLNWLPNKEWIDTNGEPSATILSIYKKKY